jgi:multidrug resistance protein MdtO
LRPTPGRLGDCLRIVVVLLALVAIAETFRISEIALSGYIVLFVSGREAASTVLTALLAGIAVVLAIFVTIAVFMLSLSEPALRIPLMAAMTLRRDVSVADRPCCTDRSFGDEGWRV